MSTLRKELQSMYSAILFRLNNITSVVNNEDNNLLTELDDIERLKTIILNEIWQTGIACIQQHDDAYGIELLDLFKIHGGYFFAKSHLLDILKSNNRHDLLNCKKLYDDLVYTYNRILPNNRIGIEVEKIRIYQLKQSFSFGKYRDKSIHQVLFSDPDYILWCIINLNHFTISNELLIIQQLKKRPQYIDALEINLLKTELIMQWCYEQEIGEEDYNPWEDLDNYWDGGGGNEWSDDSDYWN